MTSTTIGTVLKRRRLEMGLTQLELSERSGVHQEYISMLERNKRNPSYMILLRLCASLQMSIDELTEQTKRR